MNLGGHTYLYPRARSCVQAQIKARTHTRTHKQTFTYITYKHVHTCPFANTCVYSCEATRWPKSPYWSTKKRPSVRPSGCASSLKDAAAALISACTRGLSSRHMGPVWSATNTTPDKPTVFRAPHSEFPLLVIKRCFFGRVMA